MDWRLILRFLAYLNPHWRAIGTTWVLSLAILALQGLSVWIGADFIQTLLGGGTSLVPARDGLVGLLDQVAHQVLRQETSLASLVVAVTALVGVGVAVSLLRVVKLSMLAKVNQSALASIRSDLFVHVSRLPLAFTATRRPGEVASLFVRDVDELHFLFLDLTDRIFMQPLRLLLAIYLLCELSLELALWSLVIFVPTALIVHRVGRHVQDLSHRVLERVANLQAHLTEYLSSAMLARSFGREVSEQEGFEQNAAELREAQVRIMVMDAISPQVLRIALVLGGGLLLLIGGREVLVTHELESTTLTRMVLLLPMVAMPLEALASLYVSLRRSAASASRVGVVFDLQPPEERGGLRMGAIEQGVLLQQVDYSVGGVPVLRGFDAFIPARGKTVITGASGSGKTTLMNLIAGFLRPDRGTIKVDGVDFQDLDAAVWCGSLGIVHQEALLLNASVRENLAYGAPGASDDQMMDALTRVGLKPKIEGLAAGLDSVMGNRGAFFSGGERQRLAIARALLRCPLVWIFDEPTAHLDEDNRMRVIEIIQGLAREAAVIVATHDPALVESAAVHIELGAEVARVDGERRRA